MFHPVGSQPPSVYWRRRLLAIGSLVILVVLVAVTISAVASGGSNSPSGGSSNSPVAAGQNSTTTSTPDSGRTTHDTSDPNGQGSSHGGGSSSPANTRTTSATGSSSATVEKCRSSDLQIAAVAGKKTYQVGQKPMVGLEVTNTGSAPCAQDLADKQVVLKVYNGVSRVWGSHDCLIQPGTKVRTLAAGAPVQISVSWSGETSQPNCAGTRQHVGAGTYTLYASLSGKTGTAARFTIS